MQGGSNRSPVPYPGGESKAVLRIQADRKADDGVRDDRDSDDKVHNEGFNVHGLLYYGGDAGCTIKF